MRAALIRAHGGPQVLRVEQVPVPKPGPGELLVRMQSTSINHRDVWIRKGHPHPAYHVDLPSLLGVDVCGSRGSGVWYGGGVQGRGSHHRQSVPAVSQLRLLSQRRVPVLSALQRLQRQLCGVCGRRQRERRPACRQRADRSRGRVPEQLHHRVADAGRQGRHQALRHGLRVGGYERARQRCHRDRETGWRNGDHQRRQRGKARDTRPLQPRPDRRPLQTGHGRRDHGFHFGAWCEHRVRTHRQVRAGNVRSRCVHRAARSSPPAPPAATK